MEQQNNTKQVQLSELVVGDCFKIGEHEFFVLDTFTHGKVYALYKSALKKYAKFGGDNNFMSDCCDARKCLEEFAAELDALLAPGTVPYHFCELTSDDGLRDYEVARTKASLLTVQTYRRYVKNIDKYKLDTRWWLATPFTTPTHGSDVFVKCVTSRGSLDKEECCNRIALRPFIVLQSSTFVTVTEKL